MLHSFHLGNLLEEWAMVEWVLVVKVAWETVEWVKVEMAAKVVAKAVAYMAAMEGQRNYDTSTCLLGHTSF
jgi:hypothetical protein